MKREDLLFKIKKVKDTRFDNEYIGVILPFVSSKKEYMDRVNVFTLIGDVEAVDILQVEVLDVEDLSQEVLAIFDTVIENEKSKYELDLSHIEAFEKYDQLRKQQYELAKKSKAMFEAKKQELISVQDYLTPEEVTSLLQDKLDLVSGYKVDLTNGLYNNQTHTMSVHFKKEIFIPNLSDYQIDDDLSFIEDLDTFKKDNFMEVKEENNSNFYLKSCYYVDEDLSNSKELVIVHYVSMSMKRFTNLTEDVLVAVDFLNNKLKS